jgi:predicted MFS family arabinose efflux permease
LLDEVAVRGLAQVAVPERGSRVRTGRPWVLVGQGWAALAAAMGVGRFVYTPILPLMHEQAGLSRQAGADLATANYVGYLVGAVIMILVPRLTRSVAAFRASMLVLAGSLALMPTSTSVPVWAELRCVAGVTSGLVFISAAGALLAGLREHRHHLVGWGFGGVGAGIALSGVLLLVLRENGNWQEAWWCSAVLVLLGAALAWTLPMPGAPAPAASPDAAGRPGRGFAVLVTSYSLEGFGYIVAGTFLVAAVDQHAAAWVGTGAWVVVGIAAIPSAVLWAGLARRWSRPSLLVAALALQVVAVLLPVLFDGAPAALISAALYGGTFLGIVVTTLAIGNHLGTTGAVAFLTTGYSVGQILGPVTVAPLLHGGYRPALALSAAVVAASALAAAALPTQHPQGGPSSADDVQALRGSGLRPTRPQECDQIDHPEN